MILPIAGLEKVQTKHLATTLGAGFVCCASFSPVDPETNPTADAIEAGIPVAHIEGLTLSRSYGPEGLVPESAISKGPLSHRQLGTDVQVDHRDSERTILVPDFVRVGVKHNTEQVIGN